MNLISSAFSYSFVLALFSVAIYYTRCETPVVVVLSGSMEPGIYRGDILLLKKIDAFNTGQIVVYRENVKSIPIVHRVVQVHEDDESTWLLTKGDANNVNDRSLYVESPVWLNSEHIMGSAYAIIPKLGLPTIWINEVPL